MIIKLYIITPAGEEEQSWKYSQRRIAMARLTALLVQYPTAAVRCDDLEDRVVTLTVKAGTSDAARLDWLNSHPDELENVRGRVNNEDCTVREAIDYFMEKRP